MSTHPDGRDTGARQASQLDPATWEAVTHLRMHLVGVMHGRGARRLAAFMLQHSSSFPFAVILYEKDAHYRDTRRTTATVKPISERRISPVKCSP